MKHNHSLLAIGIPLMLLASTCTCIGQLCWKLAALKGSLSFYILGFLLYGSGAVLMIISFRFGELSILHPMLSMGYILSLVLGAHILKEPVTITKICGVIFILIGMVFLGISGKDGT